MIDHFTLNLAPRHTTEFLFDLKAATGRSPEFRPDGSFFIDPGGPELALRGIPLENGNTLLMLNRKFFTEPKNA